MTETKLGSVTVKAVLLVEFTHQSGWSPDEKIRALHDRALREMRTIIENLDHDRNAGRMRILNVQKVISVSHEEDRT